MDVLHMLPPKYMVRRDYINIEQGLNEAERPGWVTVVWHRLECIQ